MNPKVRDAILSLVALFLGIFLFDIISSLF